MPCRATPFNRLRAGRAPVSGFAAFHEHGHPLNSPLNSKVH